MKQILNVILLLVASCSAYAGEDLPAFDEIFKQPDRTEFACRLLFEPHQAMAHLLPKVSDEAALTLLKTLYPELVSWLSQKSSESPLGADVPQLGTLGPHHVSPSVWMLGREVKEVNRMAIGYLALKWLLANDYDRFVSGQVTVTGEPLPQRLSRGSFDRMRQMALRILKTPDDIDAMIVSILINDLGKVQRYQNLMRPHIETDIDHDSLLYRGMTGWPEVPPSFARLRSENKRTLVRSLAAGSELNIGQFVQGENLPFHARGLIGMTPHEFDFHFLHLVLDVAGVLGGSDPRGARFMTENIWKSYALASQVLQGSAQGQDAESMYESMLALRAKDYEMKDRALFRLHNPTGRALIRLSMMRGAYNGQDAYEMQKAFDRLPTAAQFILINELNVSGLSESLGILPYYAPAMFLNAIQTLQNEPDGVQHALRTTLLTLARVFQQTRIAIRKQTGPGALTVNMGDLAAYVKSAEYKKDPDLLLNHELQLEFANSQQAVVRLRTRAPLRSKVLRPLLTLQHLPGRRFAIVAAGGGSDCIQAGLLTTLLKQAGKQVPLIISVRTDRLGSATLDSNLDQARTWKNAKQLEAGLYHITPESVGTGRAYEPWIAKLTTVLSLIDNRDEKSLPSRLSRALATAGHLDTVLLLDTGGDILNSTPPDHDDQDLRVLRAALTANQKAHVNLLTTIVAAGVDSPPEAETILTAAGALYYDPSPAETTAILKQYQDWELDGSNAQRYGKTPFAWQASLKGETGLLTLPLPAHILQGPTNPNPWNPFVPAPLRGLVIFPATSLAPNLTR